MFNAQTPSLSPYYAFTRLFDKYLLRACKVRVWGFPGGSVVMNPFANAGDLGSILGLGRSPGEGSGNPLQYSCLENPMDRGAWQSTVHGVAKSRAQLSD